MIVDDLCTVIDEHLKHRYDCYGFNRDYSIEQNVNQVNILGNYQPQNVVAQSPMITIKFRVIQYVDRNDMSKFNFLDPRSDDPFLVALRKVVYKWDYGKQHALTRAGDEILHKVELKCGDEASCLKLIEDLRDASWHAFSAHFDREVDEALKSD